VKEAGNVPPVATDDFESTSEDVPVNIAVLTNDTDPDSGKLTIIGVVIGSGPSDGVVALNPDGLTFDYTPNHNFNGQDSFVYSISDGKGGTDTATGECYRIALMDGAWGLLRRIMFVQDVINSIFLSSLVLNAVTVTVNAVNDPPLATNESVSTDEGVLVNIAVLSNDSDPDSDTLTNTGIVSGSGPSSGTLTLNADGATFDYTPNVNFYGQDSFVYSISDGNGGTDTATG